MLRRKAIVSADGHSIAPLIRSYACDSFGLQFMAAPTLLACWWLQSHADLADGIRPSNWACFHVHVPVVCRYSHGGCAKEVGMRLMLGLGSTSCKTSDKMKKEFFR